MKKKLSFCLVVVFLVVGCGPTTPTPRPTNTPKPPPKVTWSLGNVRWLHDRPGWYIVINFQASREVNIKYAGVRIQGDEETAFVCSQGGKRGVRCQTQHPVVDPLPLYRPGHTIKFVFWFHTWDGIKGEAGPFQATLPPYPELVPTRAPRDTVAPSATMLPATIVPSATSTEDRHYPTSTETKKSGGNGGKDASETPKLPTSAATCTWTPVPPSQTPPSTEEPTATEGSGRTRAPNHDEWFCEGPRGLICGPFQNPDNPCPDFGGHRPSDAAVQAACGWTPIRCWCEKAYK